MIRAVFKDGRIQPLDPVPMEWADGQELRVEQDKAEPLESPEEFERRFRELEALCAENDPEDDERLRTALAEAHEQAKAMVRREMGLQ